MDSRIALPPGTRLCFSADSVFTIRGETGRGGSSIVYDGIYRTNAGDEKTVRIKECYPFDLRLERTDSGSLRCEEGDLARFSEAKAQMYEDFRLCNTLYYAEPASDCIINTINIFDGNNTVYVVSAWSRDNTLSHCELPALRDCVSVVRQTAYAIQCIHQAGFLYLDIKPDNISVINGASKRVQLFDFDSLIPLSVLKNGEDCSRYRLSYTKGFAALELRLGSLNKLGPFTDVYGIGALLFYLLFGRTPEAPDCAGGADYDFSALKYGGSFPDRLYLLLRSFFHKTLAGFYPDRYREMRTVVNELEKIEKLADPARPCLISTPVNVPVFFLGRETETAKLEEWYRNETLRVLIVSGMGGIGKSSFVRNFLSAHRFEWDSLLFLHSRGSVRRTIIDDTAVSVNGTQRFPEESEADYFARKTEKIREILRRDRALLVIDDLGDLTDPDLPELLSMGFKTILITRSSPGTLNFPVLRLDAIGDTGALKKIFAHHLERALTPEEEPSVEAVIRLLGGHTLALELFARQISASFLTLDEALELLADRGLSRAGTQPVDYQRDDVPGYDRIGSILTRLFEIDRLTAAQTAVLKAVMLFPSPGISPQELMTLSGLEDAEIVTRLIRFGWITRDGGSIYLHPLIADVIRNLPWEDDSRSAVERILRTLTFRITDESHREEQLKTAVSASDKPIVTDHEALFRNVLRARDVAGVIAGNPAFSRDQGFEKLCHAMVVNLPLHEDNSILYYGQMLLDKAETLTDLERMEICEAMEKVLLLFWDFDGAAAVLELARAYAVDDRTRAEYHGIEANFYETRNSEDDPGKALNALERAIHYARLAPHPERKHLLAELLLGKTNMLSRGESPDKEVIGTLMDEIARIMESDCLPYSEICYGYNLAMAFYCAEVERDPEGMAHFIRQAWEVAEKLYPAPLDFIDNMIIPPARMCYDLGLYPASEKILLDGVSICGEYEELEAYQSKRTELYYCLLDVYTACSDKEGILRIRSLLDE